MLRLAIDGHELLDICELELGTAGASYTIDTLRALRDGTPGLTPVFILGMDALADLPSWRSADELVREFDLAVVDRPADGPTATRLRVRPDLARRIVPVRSDDGIAALPPPLRPGRGGRIYDLGIEPVAVSSRLIRARAREGLPLDGLVPARVAGYIHDSGLYRQEDSR